MRVPSAAAHSYMDMENSQRTSQSRCPVGHPLRRASVYPTLPVVLTEFPIADRGGVCSETAGRENWRCRNGVLDFVKGGHGGEGALRPRTTEQTQQIDENAHHGPQGRFQLHTAEVRCSWCIRQSAYGKLGFRCCLRKTYTVSDHSLVHTASWVSLLSTAKVCTPG